MSKITHSVETAPKSFARGVGNSPTSSLKRDLVIVPALKIHTVMSEDRESI